MSKYTGKRIVPKHCGVWNSANKYEVLSIVLYAKSGDSYMARKEVPAGTDITDTEYWAFCADYSAQLSQIAADVDALDTSLAVLKNQVATNITASTDPDADYAAEVVDARVDDTGKAHDSLGDNIRGIGAVRSFQNILNTWTMSYGYINAEGSFAWSSVRSCWRNIPVSGGTVLVSGKFGYLSMGEDCYNIWCYDKNGNSLGGAFRAESDVVYDHKEVELLDDTAFISVTSNTSLLSGDYQSRLYLMPDARPSKLMNTRADSWQCLNGQISMTFSVSDGTVGISLKRASYLCHGYDVDAYKQITAPTSSSVEFEGLDLSAWWGVYWQTETDEEGNDASAWHAEKLNSKWPALFTDDRFFLAVGYYTRIFYVTPVVVGADSTFTINGVERADVPAIVSSTAAEVADYTAEVDDARVDDTGKAHDSLGDNIRGIGAVRSFQNILDAWTAASGWVDESGEWKSSSSSAHRGFRKIPVTGGKVIVSGKFGYMSENEEYHNIWCYDKNGNSLGGAFRAESDVVYDHKEVELLDGTAFISVETDSSYLSGDYESRVYLMPDVRPSRLLNTMADSWQCLNGQIDMTFSVSDGTVGVSLRRQSYLLHGYDLDSFRQVNVPTSYNTEFTDLDLSAWWGVYWLTEKDADGNDVSAWHAEKMNQYWATLFTHDRFYLAVGYNTRVIYVTPVVVAADSHLTINGVEQGDVPTVVAALSEDLEELKEDVDTLSAGGNQETGLTDGDFPVIQAFQTIGGIGDSLMAGYCYNSGNVVSSGAARDRKNNWIEYMCKRNGITCNNYAVGGSTANTWRSTHFEAKGVADERCDAYIIGLGVNDSNSNVGTLDDIDTDDYENNAESYYGSIHWLINKLNETFDTDICIFLLTNPGRTASEQTAAASENQALYDIAELFDNVFVIDLSADLADDYYRSGLIAESYSGGHYTPVGYAYMSKLIEYELNKYMIDNYDNFKDVPYSSTETYESKA